jgi:hypothetical protein
MELRYGKSSNLSKDFTMKADELISLILGLNIPEIDLDQYNESMGSIE